MVAWIVDDEGANVTYRISRSRPPRAVNRFLLASRIVRATVKDADKNFGCCASVAIGPLFDISGRTRNVHADGVTTINSRGVFAGRSTGNAIGSVSVFGVVGRPAGGAPLDKTEISRYVRQDTLVPFGLHPGQRGFGLLPLGLPPQRAEAEQISVLGFASALHGLG